MKSLKAFLLLSGLAVFVLSPGCGPDEEAGGVLPRMSTVSIESSEGEYAGVPGDRLTLVVHVKGESGFHTLNFEKWYGDVLKEEKVLADGGEVQLEVPFRYDFEYRLQEEEIGVEITFVFFIERISPTPRGGTVFSIHKKEVKVQTLPPA